MKRLYAAAAAVALTAKGSQLVVKLNGVPTVSLQHDKLKSGFFTLQDGPGVKGRPL